MKKIISSTLIIALFVTTTFAKSKSKSKAEKDFDKLGTTATADVDKDKNYHNYKEELAGNEAEVQEYYIEERVKEVDIPKTIIYVEKPVYYPVEGKQDTDKPKYEGKTAVQKSTESSIVNPAEYRHGTMWYDFDEDFTYEIYCQPYRVTDILLEPGEQVIEMPFLSEEQVWEIGAGVSRQGGIDTQHFFLKPAYSGLTTAFIIITDRRVYHILLKSFKDCYMTQIKWKYPNTMPFNIKDDAMNKKVNEQKNQATLVDPKYLSFDYKMSYSVFKKPYWLPKRVYDDGRRTYIVMDQTVLHMTTPVLFNKRNERINYFVDKELIVLNELIEKVTLRVGRQKVVIKKKSYKEPKPMKMPKNFERGEVQFRVEEELPPPNESTAESEKRKQFVHQPMTKKEKPKKETKQDSPVVLQYPYIEANTQGYTPLPPQVQGGVNTTQQQGQEQSGNNNSNK